jgi:hypothetical protein
VRFLSFLWGATSFRCIKILFAGLLLCGITAVSVIAQEMSPSVFHPNQEVRVNNLPSLTSPSVNASAVLATAVETILRDKDVCCGKDSALEDAVLSRPPSLKELGTKLQGRHVLSDGRSVDVRADYISPNSITPDLMISSLHAQHALLIEWNGHIYILYGVTFDETIFSNGQRQFAVHKLLLLDPRFSDQRRETEFKREGDDWGKVQGLLSLAITKP